MEGMDRKAGRVLSVNAGRVAVRRHNIDGDRQSDLTVHGGPSKCLLSHDGSLVLLRRGAVAGIGQRCHKFINHNRLFPALDRYIIKRPPQETIADRLVNRVADEDSCPITLLSPSSRELILTPLPRAV
jgi:hypothetical protein